MSDSPYIQALADRLPLDQVLRHAYAEEPVYLPAMVQPAPVYQPAPRVDVVSVRLLAVGGCVALSGGGVYLAGAGVKAAGPYLWALAGVLVSLAAVIALLKSKTSAPSSGTQVTISGGRNRIGSIR